MRLSRGLPVFIAVVCAVSLTDCSLLAPVSPCVDDQDCELGDRCEDNRCVLGERDAPDAPDAGAPAQDGGDGVVDAGPDVPTFCDSDACADGGSGDAGPRVDGGFVLDAGCVQDSCMDAGSLDAGALDAGSGDAGGGSDAGAVDAGPGDAGASDAGVLDAGVLDAGPLDAGSGDAGPLDAGPLDAGPGDAGPGDAGSGDAGGSCNNDGDCQIEDELCLAGSCEVPTSCHALAVLDPSRDDGPYRIDPVGPDGVVEVFCNVALKTTHPLDCSATDRDAGVLGFASGGRKADGTCLVTIASVVAIGSGEPTLCKIATGDDNAVTIHTSSTTVMNGDECYLVGGDNAAASYGNCVNVESGERWLTVECSLAGYDQRESDWCVDRPLNTRCGECRRCIDDQCVIIPTEICGDFACGQCSAGGVCEPIPDSFCGSGDCTRCGNDIECGPSETATCSAYDCADFLWGWDGDNGQCAAFATDNVTGSCDANGTCLAPTPDVACALVDQGASTLGCPDPNCQMDDGAGLCQRYDPVPVTGGQFCAINATTSRCSGDVICIQGADNSGVTTKLWERGCDDQGSCQAAQLLNKDCGLHTCVDGGPGQCWPQCEQDWQCVPPATCTNPACEL